MVSQAAMRGQRVVESECRCWNPSVWLLVTLLGSLFLVVISVLLRFGDMKISRRAIPPNGAQTSVVPHYQVRLVNGVTNCEGRVEVEYNGSWGTVCDDEWDMVDAMVVCRQLDCGPPLAVVSSSHFGQGTGLIVLDNVNCTGPETDLSKCRSHGWGVHNCYHYEDAAVICRDPSVAGGRGIMEPTTAPHRNSGLLDGTIRLVGGVDSCQGRVEILFRGKWGTVCDDDWDENDATVVCQQIGCGKAREAHARAAFGHGTGPILLDNVDCDGSEQQLSKCSSLGWGVQNCRHNEDAGVTCVGSGTTTAAPQTTLSIDPRSFYQAESTPAQETTVPVTEITTIITTTTHATRGPPRVRLVSQISDCQGRVEVFHNNIWGTVCDDGWNMDNAHVVCRQLGCGPALSAKTQAFFGHGTGPILLDNINCIGNETSLIKCENLGWTRHNCGHHEDAGVICAPFVARGRDFGITQRMLTTTTTRLPEGALRLVDGQHHCEGRVEMFLNSEWGTVCDDAWDLNDAKVVCHQLGCGQAMAAREEAYFGPGTGTILLDNLKCNGTEASLQECNHITWNMHNCDHSEDAGVTCSLS